MGVLAYTVASAAQGDRPWTRFNCRKGVGWGVGKGGESLGVGKGGWLQDSFYPGKCPQPEFC